MQNNLLQIDDLNDLSDQLNMSRRRLYIISKCPEYYYVNFSIPKRGSGVRQINSPKYPLRCIQRYILTEILEKIELHPSAMAFRKGAQYGIAENAKQHLNQRYILKIDVKDFFSSIDRFQIYPFFLKLGYNSFISNLLTNYCTYKSVLPQGASTSPALSNIVLFQHDRDVDNYCRSKNVIYTRYADDMIFSGDNRKDLERNVYILVKESLKRLNLRINDKKTKILSGNDRQLVTGILVNNDKITLKKETRKKIRAMIHTDVFKRNKPLLSRETQGYLAFVYSIDSDLHDKYIEYYFSLREKQKAFNQPSNVVEPQVSETQKKKKGNFFTKLFKKDW